jgi:hypothetical protein
MIVERTGDCLRDKLPNTEIVPDRGAAMKIRTAPRSASWRQFALWAAIGAVGALGLLAAFTIGPIFLALATGLAIVATLRGFWNISAIGAVSGPGLLFVAVAWLNRDGPGSVCNTTATGSSCTDEWSPWPWLAAGIMLVGLAVAILAVGIKSDVLRADQGSATNDDSRF